MHIWKIRGEIGRLEERTNVECKIKRMKYWKRVDGKGVGLEECRIGRMYEWKSKIGRVYDWKCLRLVGCMIGKV